MAHVPIKFKLRGDTPIEVIREMCDIYQDASKNDGENNRNHNGEWFIYAGHQKCKLNYTTTYYYKKDGFDDAYKAMNRILPSVTEDAFAKFLHDDCSNGGYNPELITQSDVKIDGLDLFKMVKHEWYEWGQPDYFSCSANMVSTKDNKEIMYKLLFIASPYLLQYC